MLHVCSCEQVLQADDAAEGTSTVSEEPALVFLLRKCLCDFASHLIADAYNRVVEKFVGCHGQHHDLLSNKVDAIKRLRRLGACCGFTREVRGETSLATWNAERFARHCVHLRVRSEHAELLAEADDVCFKFLRHQRAALAVDVFGVRLEDAVGGAPFS